jgi:hypothetical protein
VDYPVQTNPWRTRALVLAAVAVLELLVLVSLGVFAAGRMLSSEVATVARQHEMPVRKAAASPTAPDRPVLERTETSVVVLNGNGVAGAAAQSAARVRALTYVVTGAGNAPRTDYAKTMVMYRKGYRREAERLAAELKVKLIGPLDGLRAKDLMGAHLALVLGR